MTNIKLRLDQTIPLTFQELDDNFSNLNNNKLDAPVIDGVRGVLSTYPISFQGNVIANSELILDGNSLTCSDNNVLNVNEVPLIDYLTDNVLAEKNIAPTNYYTITNNDVNQRLVNNLTEGVTGIIFGDTSEIPIGGAVEVVHNNNYLVVQEKNVYQYLIVKTTGLNYALGNGVLQQSDGKLLISAEITNMSVTPSNYGDPVESGLITSNILRFNTNGTLDDGFTVTLNIWGIETMTKYSDGKILIAGRFTTVNGVTKSCVARLNADGTLDTSFIGVTVDFIFSGGESLFGAVILSTNKILVHGTFTSLSGVMRKSIARLNADGTLDTSFNANISAGYVSGAIETPDGKILIHGSFIITVNGSSRTGIARLNADGTLDTSFNTLIQEIYETNIYFINPQTVALQTDGKILIGGQFSLVNGISRPGLARLNSDGSLDTSFNAQIDNTGGYFTLYISGVYIQPDGKIIVVGNFTYINGVRTGNYARLNTDGSTDTSFYIDLGGDNILIHFVNDLIACVGINGVFVFKELTTTVYNPQSPSKLRDYTSNYFKNFVYKFKKINTNEWVLHSKENIIV